jgi:CheY-like chemotaxis protein
VQEAGGRRGDEQTPAASPIAGSGPKLDGRPLIPGGEAHEVRSYATSPRLPGASFRILANVLDAPLLILRDDLREMPADEWKATEAWLTALGRAQPAPVGMVLPLELPGRFGRRGELWGVELLRWLRWSAPEPIRLIPVLAVAWQPLEMILRAKHEPLLVSRGAWFARLPDVLEGSPSFQSRFITQVRTEPEKLKISRADLELLAGGTAGEAARLTHHDLANEGYSASRLWAGYLQALRQASEGTRNTRAAKKALAWAEKVRFTWLDELNQRMHQPSFQQFQVLRRSTAPPKYPEIEDASQLVRGHAKEGLPGVLRVLLVDDEFDKGLAYALLKILFGDVEFSCGLPDDSEKVYCAPGPGSGSWARFVCVKNTRAAAHWLKFWREFKVLSPASSSSYTAWLESWAACLGRRSKDLKDTDLEDVLSFPSDGGDRPLDDSNARPVHPVTVIVLDLRLSRKEPEASYSPDDFESLRFRNAVKRDRPDLPVVMLTASRQALNYVAAMAGAGPQDGWLMKEAPDVPVDDDNSSRSVHYLLNRLHVFSTLGEWYRPALEWQSREITEFSDFWGQSDRTNLLAQAEYHASLLFREVVEGRVPDPLPRRFWGYVSSRTSDSRHSFVARLVARKVAIACLLHCADWNHSGEPEWNLERFQHLLPDTPDAKRKDEKEFSKDISVLFNRDLYLPGLKSAISALLRVEYEWLLKQDWGPASTQCTVYVRRLLEAAMPPSK